LGSRSSKAGGGPLTYRESGVDIDRADEAKRRIKELARSTFSSAVLSEIGSFAGLFKIDLSRFTAPVLVASADGVGTKLKFAFLTGIHNTVGIDLVAHCTNDILVQRAFPAFFLDYIGTGRLDEGVIEAVVSGLSEGCRNSGCALLGGETAEMPGFYKDGEYDLAGFIVGIADESRIVSWGKMEKGDLLAGLPSSGLHTNGYSMVRQIVLEREKLPLDKPVDVLGRTLAEELLEPHRNYLPLLRDAIEKDQIRALAHITGGGIAGNLVRVLPSGLDAVVRRGSWEVLPIFDFLRRRGRVDEAEMYRTFNMGLGMIAVVSRDRADQFQKFLEARGERFNWIGEIREGCGKVLYQ